MVLRGSGAPRIGFLNGSKRRPWEGVKPLLDDRIAFATRILQSGTVFNLHRSTTVTDQPGIVQRICSERN